MRFLFLLISLLNKEPPTPALILYNLLLQSLLSTHTTRTHKQHAQPPVIHQISSSPLSSILLHYFSQIFPASPTITLPSLQ